MRILYVALAELSVPGAPRTHVLEICNNLAKLGHEVLLLVPRPKVNIPESNFRIVFFPFWGFSPLRLILCHIFLIWYLVCYIISFKPDLIYERVDSFNYLPALISMLTGKALISELNGWPPSEYKNLSSLEKRLYLLSMQYVLNQACGIIIPKLALLDILAKEISSAKRKVALIFNGVDIELFLPMKKLECRKELGLEPCIFYIGYIGGFTHLHDVELLIRAYKIIFLYLHNVKLILVGKGSSFESCRRLTQQLGIEKNVMFVGEVPYQRVPIYINSFDVCILPLKKESSSCLAMKLFEYWACGEAAIVTYIEKKLLDEFDNFAFFVPPENEQKLVKASIFLLENSEIGRKMGEKAREYVVKNLTWYQTAKKTEEFIKRRIGYEDRYNCE